MDEKKFPTGTVTMRLEEYSEIIARLAAAEANLDSEKVEKWRAQDRAKELMEENERLNAQIETLILEISDDGK